MGIKMARWQTEQPSPYVQPELFYMNIFGDWRYPAANYAACPHCHHVLIRVVNRSTICPQCSRRVRLDNQLVPRKLKRTT